MQAVMTSACVWEMDRNSVILKANEMALKAFGGVESEVIGKPESDFMFDDEIDVSRRKQGWLELREGKVRNVEIRRRGVNRQEVWFTRDFQPVDGAGRKSLQGDMHRTGCHPNQAHPPRG